MELKNIKLEDSLDSAVAIKRLGFYNFLENAISSITGSKFEIKEFKCCEGKAPNLDEELSFDYEGYSYNVASLITSTTTNTFFHKRDQKKRLDFNERQTPSLLNPDLRVIDIPEYISIYSAVTIIGELSWEFPFLRIFLSFLQSLMHKTNIVLDLSEQQQALIIPYLKETNNRLVENEAQIYKVFGYQKELPKEPEKSIGQHTNKE